MKTIIKSLYFDMKEIENVLVNLEMNLIDVNPAINLIRKQIVDMKATVYSRPSTSKMIVGRCGPRPKTSHLLMFSIKEIENYLIRMEMDQIPTSSAVFNIRNIISDMKATTYDFAAKLA